MSSSRFAFAAMVVGVLATPLTTIQPCPQATGLYPEVTVTKQFQPVTYCVPTSTKVNGTYTTNYPLASTSTYVSTKIPCDWDGKSASTCTITTTDQVVPCQHSTSTITSVTTVTTAAPWKAWGNGTYENITTSYITNYETVSKVWNAPFNHLGGLAIPGYDGCEICSDCGPKSDGSRVQAFNVTECHAKGSSKPQCSAYTESFVSKPAPSTTSVAKGACSTQTAVSSAGTYTFTFPQWAPETTVTAPAATTTVTLPDGSKSVSTVPEHVVTAPAQPWYATVTKTCQGPTTFAFTTTVTKTITFYVPYETSSPTDKQPVPTTAWNGWEGATTTKSADPTTTASSSSAWGAWTATSTGGSAPAPTGDEFKLYCVDTNARFKKHSPSYVGFGSDDAVIVDDAGSAAMFYFDTAGDLVTGGKYMSTEENSQYAPFEKVSSPPSGSKHFTYGSSGLSLEGASGFCHKAEAIFVVYKQGPAGCTPCNLVKDLPESSTTTSSTVTSTTMTTSTITSSAWEEWVSATTTTSDISADLDMPDPTPAPRMKRSIAGRARY